MSDARERLVAALSDRYTIERELGRGGMATVYLAHDLKHDRKVAIKVLHPHLAAVVGAARFLSEIRTTAHLQHPHLVPLFDSGEAADFLFFVMPFVDGESLRQRITRQHQLPIADAVRITSEVASALDYAHRQGVVHRDIKPENILLHDGMALVADFGIALASGTADTRLTETGLSIGTPAYMSPEQALGEREVDARSDIYALGAVAYEMVTGVPPFTGPNARVVVAKLISERAVRPSQLRKGVPRHVEECVLAALQKNPDDRFATAAALQAMIGGDATERIRMPRRRRGALGTFVGGAAALALITAIVLRMWRTQESVTLRHFPDTAAVRLAKDGEFMAKARTPASCDRAIKDYSQATNRDTLYAEAWAGLAKTEALCALFGSGDPDVGFAAARGPAERAMLLDDRISDAYTAAALVQLFHEQNFAGARRDFLKAIARDSTAYEPWLFQAWAFVAIGQLDSAEHSLRHAQMLRPIGDAVVDVRLSMLLRMRGKLDAAALQLEEVTQVDPNDRMVGMERLETDLQRRDCDRARTDVTRLQADQWQYSKALVATFSGLCDDPARARRYADSVEAEGSAGHYVDRFALAMVYAALADTAKILAALRQAVAQHNWAVFQMHQYACFHEYFSGMPEFRQVLADAHVK